MSSTPPKEMQYEWLYILGEKGKPNRAKIGFSSRINPLDRVGELATGNIDLYLYMAYRLPDWYTSHIRLEESTWHDYFTDPAAEPGKTYGDAIEERNTSSIQADRIRGYAARFGSENFAKVQKSTRLKTFDGARSEWFSVKPKYAASVISEYIAESATNSWIDYDVINCSRNNGGEYDVPLAPNSPSIFVYTKEALVDEMKNGLNATIKPFELTSASQGVIELSATSASSLTPEEEKAAQEAHDKEILDMFSWLDNLVKNQTSKDEE